MALPYAKARSTPTGTSKHYRNLEQCSVIAAVRVPDATTTNKWFAQCTGPDGGTFWILDAAGYLTEAACQTAIETALGTPV